MLLKWCIKWHYRKSERNRIRLSNTLYKKSHGSFIKFRKKSNTLAGWHGTISNQQTFLQNVFALPGAIGIIDGTTVNFSQRPAIDGEVFYKKTQILSQRTTHLRWQQTNSISHHRIPRLIVWPNNPQSFQHRNESRSIHVCWPVCNCWRPAIHWPITFVLLTNKQQQASLTTHSSAFSSQKHTFWLSM